MEKNKTIYSVALYRIMAMLIVLYYHLVTIPSWAPEIQGVFNDELGKPICAENFLNLAGLKFCQWLHINSGAFAVVMFFIASGYLISKMMDRYSRQEFLVNRAISSFPTLWVCLIIVAIFVRKQGITFSSADFLASAFPFIPFPVGRFMSAVLWTLRVEMKFYLLVALFYNKKHLIFYGYMLILFFALFYQEFQVKWILIQLQDLLFMCFPLLGVVIEITHSEKKWQSFIIFSALLNLFIFRVRQYTPLDEKLTYSNCATHILPLFLFLFLMELEEKYHNLFEMVPRSVYSIGKIVYPFYLTHVSCGLTIMFQMALSGQNNPYVIILSGVIVSFVVASLVYLAVTKPSGILMKQVISIMRKRRQ